MKQNYSEMHEVHSLCGDCELPFNPPYDIETAREAIDDSNRKAVELGYSAKQWMIVKKHYVRITDDDGLFVMSTVVRVAVEKYPPSI